MMSLNMFRIMPLLLSFFFFKKGLSTAWKYLSISLCNSPDIPFYGSALRRYLACLSWLLTENKSLMTESFKYKPVIYWLESLEKVVRYTTNVRYCVVLAIFYTLQQSRLCRVILTAKINVYLKIRPPHGGGWLKSQTLFLRDIMANASSSDGGMINSIQVC